MTRLTQAPFSNILTPCVRNCCLDEFDVCLGCCRTLDEILNWRNLSEQEKTTIMDECIVRYAEREYMLKQRSK